MSFWPGTIRPTSRPPHPQRRKSHFIPRMNDGGFRALLVVKAAFPLCISHTRTISAFLCVAEATFSSFGDQATVVVGLSLIRYTRRMAPGKCSALLVVDEVWEETHSRNIIK